MNYFSKVYMFTVIMYMSIHGSTENGVDSNPQVQGNCDLLLDTFAANTATFTYCAIRNARPITFCEKCITQYLAVLDAYQQIFEMTDETGQPCKIKLLNLDRLAIIEVIFNSESELWRRGQCDYCFETTDNGTLTNAPRNATTEFKRRHEVAEQCIDEHRNDTQPLTVCNICSTPYRQLNSYYNHIKILAAEKDNDNVCMDIVDLMNATRTQWSRELKCIPSRKTQITLYISCSILIVTPLVFYIFAMWFSKRDRIPRENSRGTRHSYRSSLSQDELNERLIDQAGQSHASYSVN